MSNAITHKQLLDLLSYDPDTGVFTRKKIIGTSNRKIGATCDSTHKFGYLRIYILGKRYMQHRLAYFYVHGKWPLFIDHINGVRTDNRIANLRECEQYQNAQNIAKTRKGAYRLKSGRFFSSIRVNGRQMFLGNFDTEAEARAAYVEAKKKHHQFASIDRLLEEAA